MSLVVASYLRVTFLERLLRQKQSTFHNAVYQFQACKLDSLPTYLLLRGNQFESACFHGAHRDVCWRSLARNLSLEAVTRIFEHERSGAAPWRHSTTNRPPYTVSHQQLYYRDENIMTETKEEEEPESKKLRSSEPDLCLLIGDEAKEYRYHSQFMAMHSSYIDTMLANPMKESQSLQLSFPDLTPELWELMVKFLDPTAVRSLSIEDAMKLAPAYDKYSFESGIKICDQVLSEMFHQDRDKYRDVKPSRDLDVLIDAFVLADDANLTDSCQHAEHYFRGALNSATRYGRTIFSEAQIRKLVPLIAKKRLLNNHVWPDEQIIMNPCT